MSSLASSPITLAAVVVTHNRLEQLKVTVTRLLSAAPEHLHRVVVVDNASTEETAAWLADQNDPRLTVLRLTANAGGAGGFEAGLRWVCEQAVADWIVVMDDDARPAPGAIEAFHARPRPEGTALAAAVYFPDGRICEMNRPSVNPFWHPRRFLDTLARWRDGYHIPYDAYEALAPMPIDMTSFVGLFLSRRMVQTAGFPDGRLFLYGDDVIYTLRLRRQGGVILFDPAIRFEHDCSTFADQSRRAFRPIWKVYYVCRNSLIMYRAAAGLLFWPLLCVVAAKWTLAAPRYGEDRALYLRLLRRALIDGVRRRTVLEHAEVRALASAEKDDTVQASPT